MSRVRQTAKKTSRGAVPPHGIPRILAAKRKDDCKETQKSRLYDYASLSPVKKKVQRRQRGVVALQEIRRYQKTTELLIRKLPFQRLVREITISICGHCDIKLVGPHSKLQTGTCLHLTIENLIFLTIL